MDLKLGRLEQFMERHGDDHRISVEHMEGFIGGKLEKTGYLKNIKPKNRDYLKNTWEDGQSAQEGL